MAKKFHIVGLGRSGTHLMKNIIDNLYEQLSIETKISSQLAFECLYRHSLKNG